MSIIGKRTRLLQHIFNFIIDTYFQISTSTFFFRSNVCRVSKEADIREHSQSVQIPNPDTDLQQHENVFTDFMIKITGGNERLMYIYIFTAIITATVIVTIIRSFVFFSIAMRASRNLHNTMFQGNFSALLNRQK